MLNGTKVYVNYDVRNRLKKVNGDIYEYWYDVENNRVDMYASSTNTMYTYDTSDGRNRLVWTKDHNYNETTYYYGAEGLIWSCCDDEYRIYHYDYRGSVVAVTDIDGNVTDTISYDSYGKVSSRTGTSNLIFGYNGRDGVLSDPNGLLYMRARYYSPDLKRFMNCDILDGSIADSSTLNLYAYVNGNPISYVDPFGLCADREDHSYTPPFELSYKDYILGGMDLAPEFGPYDDDFPYDPNEKATAEDYFSYVKWSTLAMGSNFAWWLPDASVSYNHYLDGTGGDLWVNYEDAYNEDSVIKQYLDEQISIMTEASSYFYTSGAGLNFEIISSLFSVPNGDSENWQKTIGAHYAYAHGNIIVDQASNIATMTVTFVMEDMYNFNKGMTDIASGTPDDVNGRFSVLGWAKQFKSRGKFNLSISWNINDPTDYKQQMGNFLR